MLIIMLITLFNLEVETLKIQDFIKGRNVTYAAVFQYIKRNQTLFSGHIGKTNKIELDDIAVQLLEEKYPAPSSVQVIQDTSARDELLQLHKKYAAAMEKITALTEQNAQLLVIQSKRTIWKKKTGIFLMSSMNVCAMPSSLKMNWRRKKRLMNFCKGN